MQIVQRGSIPIRSLQIALVVAIGAAAMSGSCTIQTAATRCEKTGLTCPPGWVCSADEDSCIRAGSCGNGIVSDGETCDDGNNKSGDGCSADCQSDESCGNSILDVAVGEICDDGNRTPGDGCNENCESESCGNWTVDPAAGEECDTGPGDSFGCNFDCTFRRCGDGYVNKAASEDCETTDDPEGCDGDCTFPKCGDSYVNTSFVVYTPPPGEGDPQTEECDAGENTGVCNGHDNDNSTTTKGKGNCQKPACGDGYRNPMFKPPGATAPEFCDAGEDTVDCNGNGPGAAAAKCQEPACADGYVNRKFKPAGPGGPFEFCDDGEDSNTCNGNGPGDDAAKCQEPRCGDGYVNTKFTPHPPPVGAGRPEVCDEGEEDGGNTQGCNGHVDRIFDGLGHCQVPRCGDGYHNPEFTPPGAAAQPEGCDTGETDTPSCNGNKNSDGKGNCQEPACGDGYFNSATEECDLTAPNPSVPCGPDAICTSSCVCATLP